VVFIQVLSLFAYAMMERSKFKAYIKFREQALQKKLATLKDAPEPVSPQGEASASHSASALGRDASARFRAKQPTDSIVQKPHRHEPKELVVSSHTYVSRLKKRKVMLKIHCDIEPDALLTSPNTNLLHSLVNSSLPNSLMVEAAVRHGCVVMSIDLCEPMGIDDEATLLTSTASEHEVASKVAGSILKWLHASDAQRLKDGTLLFIQVNHLVFKGCWDASTHAVQLSEDVQTVPTPEQYSITLPEPRIILLPAFQPTQQQESDAHSYSVSFIAGIRAPANAELVGWQDTRGTTSNTNEGGERGEESVAQLLACARGMFLPTKVNRAATGEPFVQVCIALPRSLQLDGQCFRLELELVRGSKLLCSRSILFMGSRLGEELQELKGWAASRANTPDPVSTFMEDLAEFLSFQGLFAPSPISPLTAKGGNNSSNSANPVEGGNSSSNSASPVKGDNSSSNSANLVHPDEGLLPVLKAEAQTPGMLHMMAEVGLELLQHAVSWGMAALAQQLLTGLMAEPLCLPFDAVACGQLPHTHPLAKVGKQQQQQQQKEQGYAAIRGPAQHVQPPALFSSSEDSVVQGQNGVCFAKPPFSWSLITCALLSYNKQCLARVLEWGRMYGGPYGFAWPWSEVDGSGYSPLQIMQRLPVDHAVLEQLLADPTARPAALQAQDLARQTDGQHKENGRLQQRDTATTEGAAARSHSAVHKQCRTCSVDSCVGQTDEFLGGRVQVGSSTSQGEESGAVKHSAAGAQPAPFLSAHSEHASPTGVLRVALKALVFGFGKNGDIKEADYRNWCFENTVSYANLWCSIVVLFLSFTVVKCLCKGLLLNAVAVSLYLTPMFLALCANTTKKRKVCMTVGKAIHLTLLLIYSMDLLPSVAAEKLAVLHLDWAVEVIMFRLMDQAQLGALLLERAISCVGNLHTYTRLGFSFPLVRALILSLCSLLVGLALDVRNRCAFLKIHSISSAWSHDLQGKVLKVQ
ncbi:hypothetical protein DUNSADRAFT_13680, partial [Dunaliella salina]